MGKISRSKILLAELLPRIAAEKRERLWIRLAAQGYLQEQALIEDRRTKFEVSIKTLDQLRLPLSTLRSYMSFCAGKNSEGRTKIASEFWKAKTPLRNKGPIDFDVAIYGILAKSNATWHKDQTKEEREAEGLRFLRLRAETFSLLGLPEPPPLGHALFRRLLY